MSERDPSRGAPSPGARAVPRWGWIVAGALAVALFAWQTAWIWPYVADDTFISLRYAERLAGGHGLSWNDGEWVEGYSNLLWVLGCAGLIELGIEPVRAAQGLGIACSALALFALAFAVRARTPRELPAAFAAPALLAVSAPLTVWGAAGLESPMEALWLVLGFAALLGIVRPGARRAPVRIVLAGLPFALDVLTRPDGPLWVAVAGVAAGAWWWRADGARRALRDVLLLAALPVAALAGQLAFRLATYGEWVPNTAHAKIAWTPLALESALGYLGGAAWTMRALVALALLGLAADVARPSHRARAAVLALPVLVFAAYLVSVGGDHFLAYRRALPALVPLAFLAADGVAWLAGAGGARRALAWASAIGAVALVARDTRASDGANYLRHERFTHEAAELGRVLRRAFEDERPLLATNGAGALPFTSKLPTVDMLGLNDRVIARTPVGTGMPARVYEEYFAHGHLKGNGSYVLDREPDIVVLGPPPGWPQPSFASDYHMERDRRFLDGYRAIRLELPRVHVPPPDTEPGGPWRDEPVRSILWLRLDGRVGVERAPDRVVVPGYFVGSYRQREALQVWPGEDVTPGDPRFVAWETLLFWADTPLFAAVPSTDGALVQELRYAVPAWLEDLELAAGRWRARVEPADAPVDAWLEAARGVAVPTADGGAEWPGGPVTIAVQPRAGAALPVRIERVVLERVDAPR